MATELNTAQPEDLAKKIKENEGKQNKTKPTTTTTTTDLTGHKHAEVFNCCPLYYYQGGGTKLREGLRAWAKKSLRDQREGGFSKGWAQWKNRLKRDVADGLEVHSQNLDKS